MPETDWPALLPNVLRALEADGCLPAETRRERGGEVRYRRKGSLSVDLRRATFRDHEAGEGGGVLALVERLTGQNGPDYLRDRGIRGFERGPERPQKRRSTRKRPAGPAARPAPRPERPGKPEHDSERIERARKLIAASEPVPDAVRRGWRAGLIEAAANPAALRWIDAARIGRTAKIPPGAAGALLAPLAPLAAWLRDDAFEAATACELVFALPDGAPAAYADGSPGKRSPGVKAGCCWCCLPAEPARADRLRLAEGMADVLALAADFGSAAGVGGTGSLPALATQAVEAGIDAVLHLDGDEPGKQSARATVKRLAALVGDGWRRCLTIREHSPGSDPAAAFEAASINGSGPRAATPLPEAMTAT